MKRFAAVAAGLWLAPAAIGHGPAGGGVGYVSSISGLKPPVVGVLVNVLGGTTTASTGPVTTCRA